MRCSRHYICLLKFNVIFFVIYMLYYNISIPLDMIKFNIIFFDIIFFDICMLYYPLDIHIIMYASMFHCYYVISNNYYHKSKLQKSNTT